MVNPSACCSWQPTIDRPGDDDALTDALAQLSFAVQAALGAVAASHDLSVTQLRLLGSLRDREPPMLAIAHALNLEKSSVSGLIDRAQQRGFVERVGADHDGRAVHVRLTPRGRAIAAELTQQVSAHIERLTDPLTRRDRDRLRGLAARLVAHDAARRGVHLDEPG